MPYTGRKGELEFEADLVDLLKTMGWEKEVLKEKTVPELIENWRSIIFERNRMALNGVPLSDDEMDQVMDTVRMMGNTPVKANHLINGRPIAIQRDSLSPDRQHAGHEVYLDLFSAKEIASGTSRYQIAEQTWFEGTTKRQGDVTLLINGMPVIHIELKASGVSVDEAATQIVKYAQEGVWRGFMGLVQVFWAISPEDAIYFANAGEKKAFNPAFYFRWGDRDNNIITNWRDLIIGTSHILSIPEAHKLIGYYTIADSAKDVLKVCRSYQYTAINAIVKRAAEQKWGNHDQLGGFIWCTTGGGKTMTSFKAGQLMIDMRLADRVVFVVDRKVLDEQSGDEYNSFQRPGESVETTVTTSVLFDKLASDDSKDSLIVTSIQKISRINDEAETIDTVKLDKVKSKRVVFIIDEAHRSQFGVMHERVKRTFSNALFFGFTGTPIFSQNMKAGELTTETVFGKCLAVYTLAQGIRDENVLGFWPELVKTYEDKVLREEVALRECHARTADDIVKGSDAWKLYRRLMDQTPMASELDEHGQIKKDRDGRLIKGIEDYIPSNQYNNPKHRSEVVRNILGNLETIAHGENGTLFSGILATDSIQEACEYWRLFKVEAPDLHVTALFDPNTSDNTEGAIEKTEALDEILADYQETFGIICDRNSDPRCLSFKTDLIDRLAHKGQHAHMGNSHDEAIDIVIVVDQLLTGFDSQWVNVLYLDKVLETDNLIQAISRTNRVLNRTEKPWGMVKFYRKPYTMKRNLNEALRLYCQGDYVEVEVDDLDANIKTLNRTYEDIKHIFDRAGIVNFDRLPKEDSDRQMFRKLFQKMKSTFRAAMLQGLKWTNEHGKKLEFDETQYRILTARYEDLPSNRGGGKGTPKLPFLMDTDLSTIEIEKVDYDYLEAQFRIVTMKDISGMDEEVENAIHEIEAKIGLLTEIPQRYARKILADIRSGVLVPDGSRTLMQYIREYQEKTIKESIHDFAEEFGLDEEALYSFYINPDGDIRNSLKLKKIEEGADTEKLIAHYDMRLFKARATFHQDIVEYISERKADIPREDGDA